MFGRTVLNMKRWRPQILMYLNYFIYSTMSRYFDFNFNLTPLVCINITFNTSVTVRKITDASTMCGRNRVFTFVKDLLFSKNSYKQKKINLSLLLFRCYNYISPYFYENIIRKMSNLLVTLKKSALCIYRIEFILLKASYL